MTNRQERIYNFKDLIYHLIKGWKLLFLSVCLCAILLTAIKYVRDCHLQKAQILSIQEEKKASEELEELSTSDQEKIKDIAMLNLSLRDASNYKENSFAMQLDPYHVEECQLKYAIESDGKCDYFLMKQYYVSMVETEEIQEQCRDILSLRQDDSTVNECISTDLMETGDEGGDNPVFSITIKSAEKDKTKKITELVKKTMDDIVGKANQKWTKHEITLLSETIEKTEDERIRKLQEENDQRIYELSYRINLIVSNLSADKATLAEEYTDELAGIEKDKEEMISKISPASISKKMILVGMILGCMIYAMCVLVIWLFNPKLQSVNEWKDNYKIEVYGSLDSRKKRGFLSDFLYKLKNDCLDIRTKDVIIRSMVSRITMDMDTEEKKLALISSHIDFLKENSDIAVLCDELKKNGMDVKVSDFSMQDMDSFRESLERKYVILAEVIDQSKMKEIDDLLHECDRRHVEVLGCIFV